MTAAQLAILGKARDSLRAAELLRSKGFYDFCVSRAYYAMFYVAEAFLLGEGVVLSKHSAVIAAFGTHFAKTGRIPPEFHRYLIAGETRRIVGDYEFGPGLTSAEADEQIARATRFLDLAERLIGSAGE